MTDTQHNIQDAPTRAVVSADDQSNSGGSSWGTRIVVIVIALVLVGGSAPFLIGSMTPKRTGPRLTHTVKRGDMIITVTAEGTMESASNKDIKCRVKGGSTVLWVIEGGTMVKPGDVLVRLDKSTIEDNINTKQIAYQNAKATYAQSESAVAVARINIQEYLKGLYKADVKLKEMHVTIAKANLTVAQNTLEHAEKMFRKGFVSQLELQAAKFSIEQAELQLDVMKTDLNVLNKYTKQKTLQDLRGLLKAAEAKLASDKAALNLEKSRLDREKRQLKNCTVKAEVAGMVIFPNAARWKQRPDIEEGASVREDQVMLIMPDLSNMQVKVGVVEDKVDLLKVGMKAKVELQSGAIMGTVKTISTVTKPSGWWTGNLVKYDTIIKVDGKNLNPGMSANSVIEVARHKDVLTVPVAAVMQGKEGYQCWVMQKNKILKRMLDLGDSNEQFIVVKSGLKEGDEIVLNPRAYVKEAKDDKLKPYKPKVTKKKKTKKKPKKRKKTPKKTPKKNPKAQNPKK